MENNDNGLLSITLEPERQNKDHANEMLKRFQLGKKKIGYD